VGAPAGEKEGILDGNLARTANKAARLVCAGVDAREGCALGIKGS
jgi:hypothetical protein